MVSGGSCSAVVRTSALAHSPNPNPPNALRASASVQIDPLTSHVCSAHSAAARASSVAHTRRVSTPGQRSLTRDPKLAAATSAPPSAWSSLRSAPSTALSTLLIGCEVLSWRPASNVGPPPPPPPPVAPSRGGKSPWLCAESITAPGGGLRPPECMTTTSPGTFGRPTDFSGTGALPALRGMENPNLAAASRPPTGSRSMSRAISPACCAALSLGACPSGEITRPARLAALGTAAALRAPTTSTRPSSSANCVVASPYTSPGPSLPSRVMMGRRGLWAASAASPPPGDWSTSRAGAASPATTPARSSSARGMAAIIAATSPANTSSSSSASSTADTTPASPSEGPYPPSGSCSSARRHVRERASHPVPAARLVSDSMARKTR
mmetsp:Transcript_32589/g.82097  ORF Transcript_32589/g.82097 Transcript_32589/m.82097 type:complete len:382 (-) Transcript_32589:550-1695(-)